MHDPGIDEHGLAVFNLPQRQHIVAHVPVREVAP